MSRTKVICGNCNTPASHHSYDVPTGDHVVANVMGFDVICNVPFTAIGYRSWFDADGHEVSDYVLTPYGETLPIDVAGTEAQSGSDLIQDRIADDYGIFGIGADEAPYVSQDDPRSEQSKIDRWSDTSHRIFTDANGQLVKTWVIETEEGPALLKETTDPKTNAKSYSREPLPKDYDETNGIRNAYVEGQDGFQAVRLIDELLTSKYHARLLNVYRDKQGFLRCGSVRFIPTQDGNGLTARCVQSDCRASLTVNTTDCTREDMETFVLNVLRHGNNHAASWFRSRPSYYKVHDYRCIIERCDPNSPHCKFLQATDHTITDPDDEVKFLLEHNSVCRTRTCKCSSILADLMPALAHN